MINYRAAVMFLAALSSTTELYAEELRCPKQEPFSVVLKSLCWDCVFPMYIAGVKIKGSSKKHNPGVPSDAYQHAFCQCKEGELYKPGIMESMWEPARLVETTFMAGCMPTLGGAVLSGIGAGGDGVMSHSGDVPFGNEYDFRNTHMYAFPLLRILNMSSSAVCVKDAYQDIDITEISELNPFYKNSSLATVATPEVMVTAAMSALAPVACLAETPLTMTNNSPIDSLWWCAGNWGMYYPLVGFVDGDNSFRATSLQATRLLALMHREGREFNTVGKANMCSATVSAKLPKQQWKMQHYFPVAENGSHVIGYPTILWDSAQHYPSLKGETDGYVLFRWNDCCNHME